MVRLHGTVETVPYNQPSVRNCPIKFVDSLKRPVCLILSEQTGLFLRVLFVKQKKTTAIAVIFVVENTGIEPVTSCMPCKRSPS